MYIYISGYVYMYQYKEVYLDINIFPLMLSRVIAEEISFDRDLC